MKTEKGNEKEKRSERGQEGKRRRKRVQRVCATFDPNLSSDVKPASQLASQPASQPTSQPASYPSIYPVNQTGSKPVSPSSSLRFEFFNQLLMESQYLITGIVAIQFIFSFIILHFFIFLKICSCCFYVYLYSFFISFAIFIF